MSESSTRIEESKEKSEGYVFLGTITERIVFITLLTLISSGSIIFGNSIPSHNDWHIHIEHAYSFKKAFWQGQLFPRWVDAPLSGYGLPIFNFYAPLIYYFFTFVDLIFKDPIVSIKISFVMPMVLCSIFGYLYLRRHGSPIASTVALAFLIFSPAIHIFIYSANWPGSTLALAFMFLALYGIDSFSKEKGFDIRNVLIVSFAYAAIILTHLVTGFVFTLISVPYFLLNLALHRSSAFVKNFIASFVLGGLLSGFYLFPAVQEKQFVYADEVLTKNSLWEYTKNFLFTYLDRNIDDGYAWAIFDHRYYELSNALFAIAIFICFIVLLINMDKVKECIKEPFRVKIAMTMFLGAFLMMTPISIFIWLLIKQLQTIQFPWRFTAFILPFGLLTMVYAFDLIGHLKKRGSYMNGFRILCAILFVAFGLLLYVDFINMYKWERVPESNLLKAATNVLWGNEEYRPNIINNPDWKEADFDRDFTPVVHSSNRNINIDIKEWAAHKRVFQLFSQTEHQIQLRVFYFPGWSVLIDGKQANLRINKQTGTIVVNVPPGAHEITAIFGSTAIRKISTYLSLAALMVYILLFVLLFRKGRRKVV